MIYTQYTIATYKSKMETDLWLPRYEGDEAHEQPVKKQDLPVIGTIKTENIFRIHKGKQQRRRTVDDMRKWDGIMDAFETMLKKQKRSK